MLHPGSRIIFNLVAFFYFANGEALKKEHEKLFERDFRICMDNFVVHKNMIIRTQDSREMGAKYLNEMDVDSRQECKRFCCETDMCDVFIFEEKKPSSCYLFHCGPPHDFKCKFTNHTNYSSAVLTISPQNTVQLEEQIHRTQQEHELKSLRKHIESPSMEYAYPEPTSAIVTQVSKIQTLTTPTINRTMCSRNQYECRATKDCIAIYNVCDGIPQCADGSDESADLGCPTEKPTSPPQLTVPKPLIPLPPDTSKYQQMFPHHKSYAPMYEHNQEQNNLKSWHQEMPQQGIIQYPVDRTVLSQPQINYGGYQRYQWDYPPYYDQSNEPYNNLNLPRQNKLPSYEQEQPRIFHHKKPGVVPENGRREPYVEQNGPFIPYYVPSANHESKPENQQPKPEPEPEHQQKPVLVTPEEQKQNPEPRATMAPKITTTEPTSAPSRNNNKDTKLVEKPKSAPAVAKSENKYPVISSDEETHEMKKSKDETQRRVVEHHVKVEDKVSVAEHFRLEENADNRMRPKGAVISLALGLTVTAIMAILITCRLRVVRRRGRRGHEPFAHDADYLVNGMYL